MLPRSLAFLTLLAVAAAQSPTPPAAPPERLPATEKELDASIKVVTGGKALPYDLDGYIHKDGSLKSKKDKKDEEKGLACSPFASAVLHHLQHGDFKAIDNKVHQQFGGEPLAKHYQLASKVPLESTEDFKKRLAGATRPADGVYLFEIRGEYTKTSDGKKVPQAHVGFLVISKDDVRQVHFSGLKKYGGMADDKDFFGFVDASQYKQDAKVQLWLVTAGSAKAPSAEPPK